uniref:Potassium channel domain-containing protein n=1 Tax=Lotharella globosa TaxID=91324 RepID=A0A6V3JIY4_9EUKA
MPPSSLGVFLFLLTAPSYGRWAHENSGVLSENSSVETRVGSETDQASGLAGIGPSLSIGKLAESRSFQNLSSKAAATAAVPARTIEFDDVTEKILPKMLGIPKVVFLFGACLLYVLVHWIVSIRGCGRRESPQVKTLNVTVVLNYADCTTATIRLENNAEESKGKNFSTREATSSVSLQWNPALSEAARDSDGNYLRVEVIDENEEIVKTSNIPVQTAGSNGDIPSYHRVQWNREGEREFLMLGISHDVGEMHRTGVKVVTKHINGQRKNREPSYAPMMTFFMIYLIVGTTFYTQWEGWDEMSAVYFCVSTMFTVGYGDFVPSDRVSRVFTALLAIVGVSFLGITLVVTQIDTVLAMVKHERTRTRTNVRKMLNGVALCFIIELFNLIFAMCALNLVTIPFFHTPNFLPF